MIKNWEALFQDPILERGNQCFMAGAVIDVSRDEAGYHAIVEGTEEYEVDITLYGEALEELYCTCPYAAKGNNCKHMAALLYLLEQEGELVSEPGENTGSGQEIQDLLHSMTAAEAKSFLLKLVQEDTSIKNRLIATFSKSIGKNEVEILKKEVDNIVSHYGGRESFIEYREASDFIDKIENFLYQKGQALIDRKCTMEAFEVVSYVFQIIGNQEMDDSDGGICSVANLCYELWEQIEEQCTKEERAILFQWFLSHQKGFVIDYVEDYIDEFLMNHFHEREMLLQKLEQLDQKIASVDQQKNGPQPWSSHYQQENLIVKRIESMKRLELTDAEVQAYQQKYKNFPAVRKSEIDDFLEKKNYDSAIALLKESKELDQEYAGLVSEYSRRLIEIYQKLTLPQQYKEELLYQVFHCRQDNLAYVNMLKQCCPDEWEALREKLLPKPSMYSVKYQLLVEEQLYRRLLDEILRSRSICSLDQYEKCLKKEFPNEVRDVYMNHVVSSAESSTDRKAYQALIKYLKKICKYPQGKEKATAIAEEWKACYKRRPAMMDELRKAGF